MHIVEKTTKGGPKISKYDVGKAFKSEGIKLKKVKLYKPRYKFRDVERATPEFKLAKRQMKWKAIGGARQCYVDEIFFSQHVI